MPRQVDHAQRRDDIAAALWHVVRDEGIHSVSVRRVAAEAGTSPSALRHYFTTQDELMGFALNAVVERVRARLLPQLPGLQGLAGATTVLEQMLPLDADRRDETAVYLAFVLRADVDPTLRGIRDEAEAQSREAVRLAVRMVRPGAGVRESETGTELTYALVDGLALHGTLWPERYPPDLLRRTLHAHLDRLAGSAAPGR